MQNKPNLEKWTYIFLQLIKNGVTRHSLDYGGIICTIFGPSVIRGWLPCVFEECEMKKGVSWADI